MFMDPLINEAEGPANVILYFLTETVSFQICSQQKDLMLSTARTNEPIGW